MPKAICDVVDKITNERCKNRVHREGYFRRGGQSWWYYLCRKHFYEMKNKDRRLWAWCSI